MVLAIEPMVNMGKPAVKVLADGWTAVTTDGSLSAHFEHTVAVTAGRPWIMTLRQVESRSARDVTGAGEVTARMTGVPIDVEGIVERRCRTRSIGSRSTGRGR